MERCNTGELFHLIDWRWQQEFDTRVTEFKFLTPECIVSYSVSLLSSTFHCIYRLIQCSGILHSDRLYCVLFYPTVFCSILLPCILFQGDKIKISITIFWAVTPFCFVLHILRRNVVNHEQDYTATQPRAAQSTSSPRWKPQIWEGQIISELSDICGSLGGEAAIFSGLWCRTVL
jgi:hypothetical protein